MSNIIPLTYDQELQTKLDKIPSQRLYKCEEYSCKPYPPDELWWWPGCHCWDPGWYCFYCLEDECNCEKRIGGQESLAEFLEEHE